MKVMHVVSLICLGFTTVSFIQFSLFGTVLPLVVEELGIGYDLMGVLMALWILVSVIAAPTIGRYIDRANPLQVLIAILTILSISSILTAFSINLAILTIARILLSFSMPFVWPVCAKITSLYSSGRRYGYLTALYNTGAIIGLALTYVIIALIGSNWRNSMILASTIGFIYIPITVTAWRFSIDSIWSSNRARESSRTKILDRSRIIKLGILLFLAFLFALYTWSFIVNWLSTFLVKELGYSYNYIAIYMVLVAMVSSVLEVAAGYYSDNVGGLKGKITILYIGLIPSTILLLSSVLFSPPTIRMASILLSVIMYRISTPSFWSIVNEVIPMDIIGRFSAIYTLAGPFSGIFSSIVNGYIVAATNSMEYGIFLSSALLLTSILLYSIVDRLYRKYGFS